MDPDLFQGTQATTEEPGLVSGRFLSDLFRSLERHNVPATQMLGDLPILLDESGKVIRPVEWADFAEFMKRLENHVGGPDGLEVCGERVIEFKPARALQSLVGFSASPYSLYRGASLWALRRAIPALETQLKEIEPNRLEIHMRLKDGLRPCPQLFHLAVGGARTLPRLLGLRDAVVTADIGDFEARYQISVPPSRTLWARITRIFRALFSAGSVLQFLETQQLELHAKHAALKKTHAALAESERRYRAITDTAVDVLCELNELGRIEYVSASINELLGYSPEQVTGSHFSLWVPSDYRERAKERFEDFVSQPIEYAITRERITLHTDSGQQIVAELSLRSYRTPEGELRMVGILRDETDRPARGLRMRTRKDDPKESDSLSRTVENLRHSASGHRIEKSLAALLISLETVADDPDARTTHPMIAATDRMAQIVESAMLQSPDTSLSFGWLETKKLVDMLRSEFRANHAGAEVDLRIDTSKAPPLVWGDEVLLAAGVGSLLDWAAGGGLGRAVTLSVQANGDPTHSNGQVVFSVSSESTPTPTQEPEPAQHESAEVAPDAQANLALATAEDAANALGGDLVMPDESSDPPISRIRLPQPKRAH